MGRLPSMPHPTANRGSFRDTDGARDPSASQYEQPCPDRPALRLGQLNPASTATRYTVHPCRSFRYRE